jgi:hypothetical protein
MATTRLEVTSTWQKVADAEQFLLENQSYRIRVRFDTTTPDPTDAGHMLLGGEAMTRMGLVGNVYIRTEEDDESSYVLVTLGE